MTATKTDGIPFSTLDAITARVDASLKASVTASMLLSLPPDEERTATAKRAVDTAKESAGNALSLLQASGAVLSPLPPRIDIPIHQLDTEKSRALLALLDQCVKAAEEVDAERGRVLEEKISDSDTFGLDLAEDINQIRARVYLEVFGATGKGLE